MQERCRLVARAPAVVVVLRIQRRLPVRADIDEERLHADVVVVIRPLEVMRPGDEPDLLTKLALGRLCVRLAGVDAAGHGVPIAAVGFAAKQDEELGAAADHHLALADQPGNTTSAREPVRSKLPCNSSRTSARTIDSPVPAVS